MARKMKTNKIIETQTRYVILYRYQRCDEWGETGDIFEKISEAKREAAFMRRTNSDGDYGVGKKITVLTMVDYFKSPY